MIVFMEQPDIGTLLAQLFVTPIPLTGLQKALLIFPLCLSIAVIYKVTRVERLSDVPAAAAALWITLVVGMYAVGIGIWATFRLFV